MEQAGLIFSFNDLWSSVFQLITDFPPQVGQESFNTPIIRLSSISSGKHHSGETKLVVISSPPIQVKGSMFRHLCFEVCGSMSSGENGRRDPDICERPTGSDGPCINVLIHMSRTAVKWEQSAVRRAARPGKDQVLTGRAADLESSRTDIKDDARNTTAPGSGDLDGFRPQQDGQGAASTIVYRR